MVEGEGAEDGIVLEETRAGIVDQDGEILRCVCQCRLLIYAVLHYISNLYLTCMCVYLYIGELKW